MAKPKTGRKTIFHQKFCGFLKCLRNMLSKKGTRQDKFVIYLLLTEVFVLVLILGLTGHGQLASALGTISMALAVLYIEIIKPWLQKPEIKIEFKNEMPFCRDCPTTKKDEVGYFIRLRVKNTGRSVAKRLRGKLVEIIDKSGKIDKEFDPLFLHWTSLPRIDAHEIDPKVRWLDPIDLNIGEWEYLDIFYTFQKGVNYSKTSSVKQKEDFVHINTKEQLRGSRLNFEMSEGLKTFKITIYGENIEPVTETYELKWDGKNYNEIEMDTINQKEANNG